MFLFEGCGHDLRLSERERERERGSKSSVLHLDREQDLKSCGNAPALRYHFVIPRAERTLTTHTHTHTHTHTQC